MFFNCSIVTTRSINTNTPSIFKRKKVLYYVKL